MYSPTTETATSCLMDESAYRELERNCFKAVGPRNWATEFSDSNATLTPSMCKRAPWKHPILELSISHSRVSSTSKVFRNGLCKFLNWKHTKVFSEHRMKASALRQWKRLIVLTSFHFITQPRQTIQWEFCVKKGRKGLMNLVHAFSWLSFSSIIIFGKGYDVGPGVSIASIAKCKSFTCSSHRMSPRSLAVKFCLKHRFKLEITTQPSLCNTSMATCARLSSPLLSSQTLTELWA
jgi:hypothetical protein